MPSQRVAGARSAGAGAAGAFWGERCPGYGSSRHATLFPTQAMTSLEQPFKLHALCTAGNCARTGARVLLCWNSPDEKTHHSCCLHSSDNGEGPQSAPKVPQWRLRLHRSAPGEHQLRIFSSGTAVLPLLSAAGGMLFPPPSRRSHSDPGLAGWTVGEFTVRQGWGIVGPGIGLGLACNGANGPVEP